MRDLGVLYKHVRKLMEGLSDGWVTEEIQNTPKRFTEYLAEFTQGPIVVEEVLKDGFSFDGNKHHSMVVQVDIPFRGACSHHLLPMFGHAHIGYIPTDKIVGLSKLARLVDAVGTENPGTQEKYCERIADILWEHIKPTGVAVVIEAQHTCMSVRGVATPGVVTKTATMRGVFEYSAQIRDEFFQHISRGS